MSDLVGNPKLLFFSYKGWILLSFLKILAAESVRSSDFCLFVMRFNVTVNNFSIMYGLHPRY